MCSKQIFNNNEEIIKEIIDDESDDEEIIKEMLDYELNEVNDDVEKMSLKILSALNLPNTHLHAHALVHYAMKELNYPTNE